MIGLSNPSLNGIGWAGFTSWSYGRKSSALEVPTFEFLSADIYVFKRQHYGRFNTQNLRAVQNTNDVQLNNIKAMRFRDLLLLHQTSFPEQFTPLAPIS